MEIIKFPDILANIYNSLTQHKIPWQFPDLEIFFTFPDISLMRINPVLFPHLPHVKTFIKINKNIFLPTIQNKNSCNLKHTYFLFGLG